MRYVGPIAIAAKELPISGRETIIGPRDVLVDTDPASGRPRAIAVLDDYAHQWSLMIRCVDGQISALVRPYDCADEERKQIVKFETEFSTDQGEVRNLKAQTFSAGGILIPDAATVLEPMESSSHLSFAFTDSEDGRLTVAFDTLSTRAALAPIRKACAAADG